MLTTWGPLIVDEASIPCFLLLALLVLYISDDAIVPIVRSKQLCCLFGPAKMEPLGEVFEVEWKLDEDEVNRGERSRGSSSNVSFSEEGKESSRNGDHSSSEDYTSSRQLDAVRENPQQGSSSPEVEILKETFSKLLLGEDMSGGEKGVSAALAVSNAITDLSVAIFGKICRLEPLPSEKKLTWKRGMEWLLSVSDYIVELTPSLQTFPDGTKREVMTSRPRQDLYVNLPALLKLDNMIIEVLDSLEHTEFWYVDQEGVLATQSPPPKEKWWLPVPRVPTCGLSGKARKQLQQIRTCTNQILKAAMAINCCTLADMEVSESYLETLSKNGYGGLEELINGYNFSDQFSPESLLDCLNLSSQHRALEIANQLEASIHISCQKTNSKHSKLSWEMVKELVVDADKREVFAYRAESLLACLRQRFPGLPQTTLHMSKIQHNKDLGKSILESYSRAVQSLAFNIVARIDDLLHVDDLTKPSDPFMSKSQKSPRKALTEYLAIVSKGDHTSDDLEEPDSCSAMYQELIVTADELNTLYSCI